MSYLTRIGTRVRLKTSKSRTTLSQKWVAPRTRIRGHSYVPLCHSRTSMLLTMPVEWHQRVQQRQEIWIIDLQMHRVTRTSQFHLQRLLFSSKPRLSIHSRPRTVMRKRSYSVNHRRALADRIKTQWRRDYNMKLSQMIQITLTRQMLNCHKEEQNHSQSTRVELRLKNS